MTSQLDKVFEHELDVVQSLKGTLSKKDKIHFCKWISRLQYICRTKHERTIRNRYLELLSLQIQLLGHLEEPFTRLPLEGNLESIPSYWLERLQKTRAGLSRGRSPQPLVHERQGPQSPRFSHMGIGQHVSSLPHQFGDHRHVSFGEDNANPDGYAYVSSALGGNLSNSGVHTDYKHELPKGQQQAEFPLSSFKGASFTSQSFADEPAHAITMAAQRDTPTFDTIKAAKRARYDTPDASLMRDSFPDIQYLQLTRPPLTDALSNRMNTLLQHEIPTHLQGHNQMQPHSLQRGATNSDADEANGYNISIAELRAVPEAVPSMVASVHKLVASVIDNSSVVHQFGSPSRSCSGLPRATEQSLSVESIRSRRILSASRMDNGAAPALATEQRYVVAATIEAPISAHTSRSGTAASTRSARGSEALADPPIVTASQRDLGGHPATTLTDDGPDCHVTTMNVLHASQALIEPSEARPVLSPRRSAVSYVTSEVHAEPLPTDSRPDGTTESVTYRTQKDYATSEPSSVVHSYTKDGLGPTIVSDALMTSTDVSLSTEAVADADSGVRTLIIKPRTSSSVPELASVQVVGTIPLRGPESFSVAPPSAQQDNNGTENEPAPTVLCAPLAIADTTAVQETENEVLTAITELPEVDAQTLYLEGTHQDDHLIKPVKADFVPHVIPTSSPRSGSYKSVMALDKGDISPARSPTGSADSRHKKPRVRLLPTDSHEPVRKLDTSASLTPDAVVAQPSGQASCVVAKSSPRRMAGQSLYSDLLFSRMESLASSISQSILESKGPNPDLITQPPMPKQDPDLVETLLTKKEGAGSSFVAPDLADAEDNVDQSLYFVVTDKRGQDVLSPDTVTCEAAGRRLINSSPPDDDEAAVTAIMSTYQHFGQRTFEERSPSSDFDEPEPPMVVCDAGDAPPVVIRAGAVAPPMSFEENIALLQSAKQDGCISYSRSRAGSRALSLSRRSVSAGRRSEAPPLQPQRHCK
ncbi:hypothetical protein GL50803_005183 [Giardia duodenalis]|uniref:Uncharacterized protein n=1 Tax=Giardia intestinalis (strain ATCC 50803 / WB clone C6) TaxID=184922 RepID=A8BI65_GIAIC|nr:hypothetical protein GL50803_005183 [Giardia intestinalis]KAE8305684.1 hypothetical protein GL50803_005183 [Giardia intestinalis]|eukprot:XP_001706781.1 Hypothetical protein GL50803_5183 [Giardia lamblia ATCC 50803]